jgi:thiol:disulfide interchange protein DsbD
LGYAFFAPPLQAAMVFVALGVGLALPFLLIAWIPALGRLIPRPGAWTDTFKKVMAIPMYATVAWLVWLLFQQRGGLAVAVFAVAAVGVIWMLRDAGRPHASTLRRWLPRLLALVVVAGLAFTLQSMRSQKPLASDSAVHVLPNGLKAEPYSAQRLLALRTEGRVVFVDVTADWCITCKVNERAVLFTPAFKTMFEQHNAVYMIADNTEPDEAIGAFLRTHKAVGLPLYVVYPANGGEGRVLPTVLTQGMVSDALTAAGAR